jgi:hypothetical protein
MIDYGLVAKAIAFYEGQGFKYVETPWLACHEAIYTTIPGDVVPFKIEDDGRFPVGSAEQGFLEMMLDRRLRRRGRYVSAGPCFRNEPRLDWLHQETFFKVELIHVLDSIENLSPKTQLSYVISTALDCLSSLFDQGEFTVEYDDDLHADINLNGIEVGSYGIREYEHADLRWVYGTGLALPRTTIALGARNAGAAVG